MTVEELMNYVLSQIVPITDKYKNLNICNLGPGRTCANHQSQFKPGTGCCVNCRYHTIENGCTIVNLCCIAYFCDEVKNQIDPLDWKKLKSTIIVLQGFGLEPRQTWEKQITQLSIKQLFLNAEINDFYNIFKTIFEHESN